MINIRNTLTGLVAASALLVSATTLAAKPDDRITIAAAANMVAATDGEFSSLVAALDAFPSIAAALDGNGQFTVFAPTNEAFDKLNALLLADFCYTDVFALAADQTAYVAEVLLYHVARGRMDSNEVLPKDQIRMLSRDFITREPGSLVLTDALNRDAMLDLEWLDTETDNGIIHGINEVVLHDAPATNCP